MLAFKAVDKTLGQTRVLDKFSLDLRKNKITCIIGPSGCGKTTILQMLAGLEKPDAGRIAGTEGLRLSYVFQDPRLLPWKTVAQNISFVLQEGQSDLEQKAIIKKCLTMMGLYAYRDQYPKALSGGMKQRLALARAFAYPHDLLLMDEPFKSLDLPLHLELVHQVAKMWQENPRTIILVTHDLMDALLLGHQVIVLTTRPALVAAQIEIEVPLEERNILQEPLPAKQAQLIKLLEDEKQAKIP